jgi:hypothetical protein
MVKIVYSIVRALRMLFSSRPFRDDSDADLSCHLWAVNSSLLRALHTNVDRQQIEILENLRDEIEREMNLRGTNALRNGLSLEAGHAD